METKYCRPIQPRQQLPRPLGQLLGRACCSQVAPKISKAFQAPTGQSGRHSSPADPAGSMARPGKPSSQQLLLHSSIAIYFETSNASSNDVISTPHALSECLGRLTRSLFLVLRCYFSAPGTPSSPAKRPQKTSERACRAAATPARALRSCTATALRLPTPWQRTSLKRHQHRVHPA